MESIDLPTAGSDLYHFHLLGLEPTVPPVPNASLMKRMTHGRSRQSAISRKRQAFISGMNAYRMSGDERAAKQAYLDEWHSRMGDNE